MNALYRRILFGWPLLFFIAAPYTVAQVSLVADIAPGEASSGVSNLTAYGDALYFSAEASSDTRGLWRYVAPNGTAELVVPLDPDEVGPTQLAVSNDRLFFTVNELLDDGVFTRIWSFDAETDIAEPISGALWPFTRLVVFDGRLFFTSCTDSVDYGLWSYDADADTTTLASSGAVFESGIGDPTEYAGLLFFRARPDQFTDDYELWSYNATTGEVTQAADIAPAGSGYPTGLTVYDGRLFFAASDEQSGVEL